MPQKSMGRKAKERDLTTAVQEQSIERTMNLRPFYKHLSCLDSKSELLINSITVKLTSNQISTLHDVTSASQR